MKMFWPLVFILVAVLCWGAYVPTLHHGQIGFGTKGPLRAFLFVGVAYFLVAVVVPSILIFVNKVEPAQFASRGMLISTIAGVLGAIGALGVIYALKSGGKPTLVAPLVFAGAPIMNTFVSMLWDRPTHTPDVRYFLGLGLAAVGAGLVLAYKPH
jgi:hypothetical protein